MKKSTINTILMSVIVLLSVSICFLIFCIVTRPRYVIVTEPDTAVITEAETLPAEASTQADAADADAQPTTDNTASNELYGKTSTRVNIRDAASSDAKVLDTVDEGTTFDILEIQDNGWTKIVYEGSEAYISSDFVILVEE